MTTLNNSEVCELLRHTCLFGGNEHERDDLIESVTDSSSVIERAGLFERLHILEQIFDKASTESIEDMFVKSVKAQLHSTVAFCLTKGIDQDIVQRSLRHAVLAGHIDMIDLLLPCISDDEDINYVLRVVEQTALNANRFEKSSLQENYVVFKQRWERHKISRELPDHTPRNLLKRKM